MTHPVEEEFCHRIKLALRAYANPRETSRGEPVRTCCFNGIYISDREGRLRAHIYATKGKPWAHGGMEFTRIFEETAAGIESNIEALQFYLPRLRDAQILDDLAGI